MLQNLPFVKRRRRPSAQAIREGLAQLEGTRPRLRGGTHGPVRLLNAYSNPGRVPDTLQRTDLCRTMAERGAMRRPRDRAPDANDGKMMGR